ncbi:MAG: hypothetical protein WA118_10815 [Carboxydocellales bacterium]
MECPTCGFKNDKRAECCTRCETAFIEGYYENLHMEFNVEQRPTGISILAAFNFLGGIGLLIVQAIYGSSFGEVSEGIGISSWILIISLLFLAITGILSGVGMWKGSKWGWWLGSFYYGYGILRNTNALIVVLSVGDEMGLEGDRGVEYYIAKYSVRIAFYMLLFLYFFKDNVLEFFDLSCLPKLRSAGIIAAVIAALGVVSYIGTSN